MCFRSPWQNQKVLPDEIEVPVSNMNFRLGHSEICYLKSCVFKKMVRIDLVSLDFVTAKTMEFLVFANDWAILRFRRK